MYRKLSLYLLPLLFISNFVFAQNDSRSGFPAPQEPQALRMFPCGGTASFSEGFSGSGLPAGWEVRDLDGQALSPQIDTVYQKGWHVLDDFKTSGNRAIASSSWYDNDTTPANDWLILPAVQVGNNTCFSWFAYSQDRFYAESYEVLISLDAPVANDSVLVNMDTLMLISQEGFFINYRSVNLSEIAGGKYKNQQAYIAFRHTSLDQFMLVLDDIRLAEVEDEDLGIHPVQAFSVEVGDSVFFTAGLRNYGADTLTISGDEGIEIAYSVNGGTAVLDTILRNDTLDFKIAPNDTIRFTSSKDWDADNSGIYYICMWSNWANDQNTANDTFCIRSGVGVDITSIEDQLSAEDLQLFPNPVNQTLNLRWAYTSSEINISIIDMLGKQVLAPIEVKGQSDFSLSVANLPKGMYFLNLRDAEGRQITKRFVKN